MASFYAGGANTVAADAAHARAAQCRERRLQLQHRRQVGLEDVQAAHAALQQAQQRAERALQRLDAIRLRRLIGPPFLLVYLPNGGRPLNVAALRNAAARLGTETLFAEYFAIGGKCSPLELDAFIHAALQLPPDELSVVAHAVWELTEF
jgi:hypothetical protein